MSINLFAPHYPQIFEATYLKAAATASQKSLTVKSSQGIVENDYLIIEDIGGENTELAQVDTVDGTSITLVDNLNFAHAQGKPIYVTPYNQINFYYDTDEDGDYSDLVTGSPIDIDVDQSETILNDPDGSALRYYKFTYYNETTKAETDLDDSVAIQGGVEQYLCSVEDIKIDCGLDLDDKTKDELIEAKIKAASDHIVNQTGVAFIKKVITSEYIDIDDCNARSVFTKYAPIYSIEHVYDNGIELTYNADPNITQFDWYAHGEIRNSWGYFTPGNRMVKIDYTAWRDNVPEEIRHACIVITGIWAGIKKRSYEGAEGVAEAVRVNAIPKEINDILGFYRRRSI